MKTSNVHIGVVSSRQPRCPAAFRRLWCAGALALVVVTLLAATVSPSAADPPTFVQNTLTASDCSASYPNLFTYHFNPTVTNTAVVGHAIIVAVATDSSGLAPGSVFVADTQGNIYTPLADHSSSFGMRTLLFSAAVATQLTGGVDKLFVTFPGPTGSIAVSANEFKSLDQNALGVGLDYVTAGTGDGHPGPFTSLGPTSGVTTARQPDLLFAAFGFHSTGLTTFPGGTGYTKITSGEVGCFTGTYPRQIDPEYQVVSSTGPFTASSGTPLNPSTDDWAADLVAFIGVQPPTISTAFVPPSIADNTTSTLTLTITNPNPFTTLTGIGFTDNMPLGLTVTAAASPQCNGGTVTFTSGSLTLANGSVGPSPATCTVTATVQSATPGSYTNPSVSISATESGTAPSSSGPATLTVTNATGVSAAMENGVCAGGGDGNGDGIPDRNQDTVASLTLQVPPANPYVTIVTSGGTCGPLRLVQTAAITTVPNDPQYTYPFGLISFEVPCTPNGGTVTVQEIFHGVASIPEGLTYRKYGPAGTCSGGSAGAPCATNADCGSGTCGSLSSPPHFYTLPNAANYKLIPDPCGGGATALQETFTLTDGGVGDDDLSAHGLIVDQGGPAIPAIVKTVTSSTANPLAGSQIGYDIVVRTEPCFSGSSPCSGGPSNDVRIEDPLPTDGSGNQQVSVLSSNCSSNAPSATVPACTGGAAVEGPPGLLTWTFPGNSCSPNRCVAPATNAGAICTADVQCPGGSCTGLPGTCVAPAAVIGVPCGTNADCGSGGICNPQVILRAHLDVTLNNNLNDGTQVCNPLKYEDDEGCVFSTGGPPPAGTAACVTVDSSNLSCTKNALTVTGGTIQPDSNIGPGAMVTYEITVANSGDAPATGVVISDPLPAGVNFQPGSATPSGFPDDCTVCGTFNSNTNTIQWQYPTIPPISLGGTCVGGPTPNAACTTQAACGTKGVCANKVLEFTVQVPPNIAPDTVLFNVATTADAAGHFNECDNELVSSGTCMTVTKTAVGCTQQGAGACSGTASSCFQAAGANGPTFIPGRNDVVTYDIAVTNNDFNSSCTTAQGVTVTDTIPTGETYLACGNAACPNSGGPACCTGLGTGTCPSSCSVDSSGSNVIFSVGDMGTSLPTQHLLVQAVVNPTDADGTALTDIATAQAGNGGTAKAQQTLTVKGPDLALKKIVSPNPVEPGGTIDYCFILTNPSPNCAPQVTLKDVLPTNAQYQDGSEQFLTTGCGSAPSLKFAANQSLFIVNPPFDLPGGAVCKACFNMLVPEGTALGSTVLNTVSAVDAGPFGPQTGPDTATSQASAAVNTQVIGLTKAATGCAMNGSACNPQNPPAGSQLDYTITVNTGAFAATGVVVTDSLPSNSNTATPPAPVASFAGTTCPSWSLAGSVLTCNLPAIVPNSSASFHVTISINSTNPSGTAIINSATATDDTMDSLNTGPVKVTDAVAVVNPPAAPPSQIQLSVTAPSKTRRGGLVTFHATVQNTGSSAVDNVSLTDTLPGSFLKLSSVGPRWAGCTGNKKSGSVTCNLGDLDAEQSTSVTIKARVNTRGVKIGDVIDNTVNVNSADGGTASQTAIVTVTVTGR